MTGSGVPPRAQLAECGWWETVEKALTRGHGRPSSTLRLDIVLVVLTSLAGFTLRGRGKVTGKVPAWVWVVDVAFFLSLGVAQSLVAVHGDLRLMGSRVVAIPVMLWLLYREA